MLLIRAIIYASLGLILVASRLLSAEPGFSSLSDREIPSAVRAVAENVLELWTPGPTVLLSADSYAFRRRWLEANVQRFPQRYQINLIELSRCEERKQVVCYLSEFVQRSSAFVLKGGVLQTVRRAFSWDQMGLSHSFARLALQWQEEMKYPALQEQTRAAIEDFVANPMGEVVFLLSDKTGATVFDSSVDKFKFQRYGTVHSFAGRVDLGGTTVTRGKKKQSAPTSARVYILNDNTSLDSPAFGGLAWVMNDFAQIKIEKDLPALESALIEECQPGARLFSVGFPESTRGHELSITRGKALTMGEFAIAAQEWPYLGRFLSTLRGRTVLVTDADSERGMQGGPILTEDGRACGILKDGIHTLDSGVDRHFQLTIPF